VNNNDVFSVAAFFIMWCIGMLIMLGGTVIFFVVVWRFMKAHESIAQSLKLLAANIKQYTTDTKEEITM
jgi:hypothetical protein